MDRCNGLTNFDAEEFSLGVNENKPSETRNWEKEAIIMWSLGCLIFMLQPNIILELGEESVISNRGKATAAMLWLCRKAEKQLGSNYLKLNCILLNQTMAISFVLSCSVHVMLEQGYHSCHSTKLPHWFSLFGASGWSEELHGITVSLCDPIS